MTPDPRYGLAALAAVEAAGKAVDAGNRLAMRHAVRAAFVFLDRCDDADVLVLVLDRLVQIARRIPASPESEAMLARAEAVLGPRGHA